MSTEKPVRITEIKKNQQGEFVLEYLDRGAKLGGKHDKSAAKREAQLKPILTSLKDDADKLFVLEWEGSKIPRGAIIGGKEIVWTQSGRVLAAEGEEIGYYDRLVSQGGENGKQNQMIVYTYKPQRL